MDTLTRLADQLLRRALRNLPEERRAWGTAVLTEAGAVPAGRTRLSWLLGGFWFVARETRLLHAAGAGIAATAASVSLVWFAWNPGSTNPATPINRAYLITTVATLTLLPWFARRLIPVGPSRSARAVRAGGYLLIWALLLVQVGVERFSGRRFEHFQAFNQDNWRSDMVSGAIVGSAVIFLLTLTYAIGALALTARRATIAPATLAAGSTYGLIAGVAIYALTPLGSLPHIDNGWLRTGYVLLLLALVLGTPITAARRTPQRVIAGLLSGATAALVITNLTITTMLLMPRAIPLIWANPDPAAPHGTPFEIQMTLSDTAGQYLGVLVLAPLIGLVAGLAAESSRHNATR